MQDLKRRKLRGLVLDLRFNPGGLLRSAIEVSKLYISKGRIVSTKSRTARSGSGTPTAATPSKVFRW